MENEDVPLKPSDWCKEKQEEALDREDMESFRVYYELAGMWMSRGM